MENQRYPLQSTPSPFILAASRGRKSDAEINHEMWFLDQPIAIDWYREPLSEETKRYSSIETLWKRPYAMIIISSHNTLIDVFIHPSLGFVLSLKIMKNPTVRDYYNKMYGPTGEWLFAKMKAKKITKDIVKTDTNLPEIQTNPKTTGASEVTLETLLKYDDNIEIPLTRTEQMTKKRRNKVSFPKTSNRKRGKERRAKRRGLSGRRGCTGGDMCKCALCLHEREDPEWIERDNDEAELLDMWDNLHWDYDHDYFGHDYLDHGPYLDYGSYGSYDQ